jgi:hypothetical protein
MIKFERTDNAPVQINHSFLTSVRTWWNCLQRIVSISFEISLHKVLICFYILSIGFRFEMEYPGFLIKLPQKIVESLSWISSSTTKSNKGCEIEINPNYILKTGFSIHQSMHCDHAGLSFEIHCIFISIIINIYDSRHWDYDNNRWQEWDYDNGRWK